MLATGGLPQVAPIADDQRDECNNKIDRIKVNRLPVNRAGCAARLVRHLCALQKRLCLAKDHDGDGEKQPNARMAKKAAPTRLLLPDRKAKKI